MIAEQHLREFHDASLVSIRFLWAAAVAEIVFAFHSGKERVFGKLICEAVSSLHCPRKLPWGESQSVNTVAFDRGQMARSFALACRAVTRFWFSQDQSVSNANRNAVLRTSRSAEKWCASVGRSQEGTFA